MSIIWFLVLAGNTVNVASRMESTGKAGAIQVTEETCHILQQFNYTFEQRGLVAVKGKGQLMTYYLQVGFEKPERFVYSLIAFLFVIPGQIHYEAKPQPKSHPSEKHSRCNRDLGGDGQHRRCQGTNGSEQL